MTNVLLHSFRAQAQDKGKYTGPNTHLFRQTKGTSQQKKMAKRKSSTPPAEPMDGPLMTSPVTTTSRPRTLWTCRRTSPSRSATRRM
jgi:hypothetical protein